jgi:hypothetical protein
MDSFARVLATVVAFAFMLASNLTAEIPHLINYQGRITDGAGDPIDGSHSLTFAIYADSTGGAELWTETHSSVVVSEGLFDVVLGSIIPIGSSVFAAQPRWLGISINLGPESVPRTRILATAYAYYAEHADTASYALQAADDNSGWTDDGSVVRLTSGSDSVGIGTVYPAERLHVEGNIRLKTNSGIAFGSDNSRLYALSSLMVLTADDDLYLSPDDDIYIRRDGYGAWVHFDNSSQKLGIGITNPPYKLTVQGEISIAVGGASKYHINYYNNGLNFAETGVADRRLHIGDGGNVGIGTADPGAKLGVNGDLKVNGAFRGDISSATGNDGAPYPRPAYNSGWVQTNATGYIDLTHNIGGDYSNYIVDFSRMPWWDVYITDANKYAWYELTDTDIKIHSDWDPEDWLRVRIWVIE